MTAPYKGFAPIIPPRTEVYLDQRMLSTYEGKGHWSQLKRNGTNSVIFVPPDRKPFAYDRRGNQQKAWRFTSETARPFADLPGRDWYVFNAELLNKKNIKQTLYLFDLLVSDGVHLLGTTYQHRYRLLIDRFDIQKECFGHYEINHDLWLAINYTTGFTDLFNSISEPEDEGLMVKDSQGIYRGSKANDWMTKILKVKPKVVR